jgi:integrase
LVGWYDAHIPLGQWLGAWQDERLAGGKSRLRVALEDIGFIGWLSKKQRTAKLTNGAARAMSDWLAIRGSDEGPLFLAINKSDKVRPAARLTSQAVYNMLKRRAAAAGVAHFSPHDLRRTYVSDLLEAGADIATVAKMAGHSNVQTTARYDRRPEQAKDKAAELLHFPYKSKAA